MLAKTAKPLNYETPKKAVFGLCLQLSLKHAMNYP